MIRRTTSVAIAAAIVLLLGIQLLLFGRQHTNPPVTAEPVWPDSTTRALAVRACFDCHSNETTWPWYSNVAPVSWILLNHIQEGRAVLNFSEWDRPQEGVREAGEVIREGEMPPGYYRLLHRSARLSADESTTLAQALGSLR
jgi:hypothetical protein